MHSERPDTRIGIYRHFYDWQLLDPEKQGEGYIRGQKADVEGGTMISRQDKTREGKVKLVVNFTHPRTELVAMKEITRDTEFSDDEVAEEIDQIMDGVLEKK